MQVDRVASVHGHDVGVDVGGVAVDRAGGHGGHGGRALEGIPSLHLAVVVARPGGATRDLQLALARRRRPGTAVALDHQGAAKELPVPIPGVQEEVLSDRIPADVSAEVAVGVNDGGGELAPRARIDRRWSQVEANGLELTPKLVVVDPETGQRLLLGVVGIHDVVPVAAIGVRRDFAPTTAPHEPSEQQVSVPHTPSIEGPSCNIPGPWSVRPETSTREFGNLDRRSTRCPGPRGRGMPGQVGHHPRPGHPSRRPPDRDAPLWADAVSPACAGRPGPRPAGRWAPGRASRRRSPGRAGGRGRCCRDRRRARRRCRPPGPGARTGPCAPPAP